MSISSWVDDLPIENWAAAVARLGRRVRRRIARRPLRSAGGAVALVGVAMIASNALWEQTSRHPAPLWTAEATEGALVASHTPSGQATGDDAISVRNAADSGPDGLVERIQTSLAARGYYDGEVDGYLTTETVEAIELFEADAGLAVTGEPSLTLLTAVSEPIETVAVVDPEPEQVDVTPAAPTPRRVTNVAEIQAALNSHGYGPLTVDGVMGPRTQEALAHFAASRGIPDNGVTPGVLRALAEPGG